jgi:hypothetical protein
MKKISNLFDQKLFRHPIWQFIGTVAAILAIVATYHVFILSRETKEMRVVTLTDAVLIENPPFVDTGDLSQELSISYKGETVTSLSLLEISLENSGTKSVLEDDYQQPIRIVFPRSSKIIDARIINAFPRNIYPEITAKDNTATVSPVLLNSGDRIIIRLIVNDMPPRCKPDWRREDCVIDPFEIDARIVEIPSIQVSDALSYSASRATELMSTPFLTFVSIPLIYGITLIPVIASGLKRYKEREGKTSTGIAIRWSLMIIGWSWLILIAVLVVLLISIIILLIIST